MKRAFGVIELLISFLLISIIVAGFMHMTLIQMQDSKLEQAKLEEVQRQADEKIEKIEQIREQHLQYDDDLINDFDNSQTNDSEDESLDFDE